jgi:para-aminobenzoate synthetase component I
MPLPKNRLPEPRKIDWIDPLALIDSLPGKEHYWMLLYSGIRTSFTGRYSFLGLRADAHIKADDFTALEHALENAATPLDYWFGYLGYGLKNTLEQLPPDTPSSISLPSLWMIRYRLLLVFDHEQKEVVVWAREAEDFSHIPTLSPCITPAISPCTNLHSNMSRAEYLDKVTAIQQAISRGELYQANLTRKFYGTLNNSSPVALFKALCQVSPSPYSALFNFGDTAIISSSPEQFITLQKDGTAFTRPIKGSAPRFAEPDADEKSRTSLMASEKNRAENLMIVDLMRNDLSRSCEPGSVKVSSLFDCTSYATIHHLSSTITAQKKTGLNALDLVKGCFPPGSMTGTPKIKAMELCSRLERQERGVYSGCLGWIEGESAELSVVIRTLILQGDKFEFQVGGAIVADSVAEEEWQETLTKARAIAGVLGIAPGGLEAL